MRDNTYYLAAILARSSQIRELLTGTRELIAASKELLAEPAPSTFLGRKIIEPFAQDGQRSDQASSIEMADVGETASCTRMS